MKLSFLRRACALALSLCLLSSPALALSLGSTVRIDPGKAIARNGGAFEGWGTSLCWWANRLGYCDTLAQLAADAVFGADGLRGIQTALEFLGLVVPCQRPALEGLGALHSPVAYDNPARGGEH